MKKSALICSTMLALAGSLAVSCAAFGSQPEVIRDALYLGVKDYGAPEVNKDHKKEFQYRFLKGGEEQVYSLWNGEPDAEGEYDYPLQNLLKEGYRYALTLEEGVVEEAGEIPEEETDYVAPVQGVPGERTVKNFLKSALMSAGTTLYIYGGGWDWQDVGSSLQARTLGVSPDWVRFFYSKDENFTYKSKNGDESLMDPTSSYYPYGEYNEYYYAGLDCSGYVGWALYNTLETENGQEGYVQGATGMAKRLAERGFGDWTQDVKAPEGENGYEMKPGDVMSINGHVWISLGTCADASVVILHSAPSKSRTGQPGGGVQISAIGKDTNCAAYALAEQYMSSYYPQWYARYGIYLCDPEVYFGFEGEPCFVLDPAGERRGDRHPDQISPVKTSFLAETAGRFTWDPSLEEGLSDPEKMQDLTPAEVLAELFGEEAPVQEAAV